MTVNYTPMTAASGNVLTAAQWNTEVRDLSTGLQAAWTAYTPTLTSTGTNPTMGTGNTAVAGYQRVGKTIWGAGEIVAGTVGFAAGTGSYRLLLPVAMTAAGVSAGRIVGDGVYFDNSTSVFYQVILVASTTTTCTMSINASSALMSATSPVVPANSDQWRYQFLYEAA